MKKIIAICLLACTTTIVMAQTKTAKPAAKPVAKPAVKPAVNTVKPLTTLDTASYGFGISLAANLKNAGIKSLNYDMVLKGLKDTFNGAKLLCSEEEAQEAIQSVIKEANKMVAVQNEAKFAGNIEAGKAFMEKNKTQPGVKSTPSGIQYMVLTEGTGAKPAAITDQVTVHYKGQLLDGKQFDSSYDRNEPATFPLNRVIPGWSESVMLMSVGSKYRFWIPYNLAYGERGAGEDIPPFSTLMFEIELIKIN